MIPYDFGSIAIDTNVLIYALDSETTDLKGEIAREILYRRKEFPMRIPLQVAAETFRVLTRKLRWHRADAGEVVDGLLAQIPHTLTTADTTRAAIRLAVNHDISSWDALLVTSAAAGGCGALLSEDFQDGRSFDAPDVARRIVIVNPFAPANLPLLARLRAVGDQRN